MNIAPPTPLESWNKLSKMREMFRILRDERLVHPLVSEETKRHTRDYYNPMMEAIDAGMSALVKVHKLNVEPVASALEAMVNEYASRP